MLNDKIDKKLYKLRSIVVKERDEEGGMGCQKKQPNGRWYCSRAVGHAGPHIAMMGVKYILAIWYDPERV